MEMRIPSFVAGAPEMVSTEKKLHFWRHGYRWWIDAQECVADWSNHRSVHRWRWERVKTKTSTLEWPITKRCLLESIKHWKCLVFPDLFKRLCVTFTELTWCPIKFEQWSLLRHLGLSDTIFRLRSLAWKKFLFSLVNFCVSSWFPFFSIILGKYNRF